MIDPSVRAVLRSKYSIRRFFAIFGALLLILLLLLWLITTSSMPASLRDASTNFLGNFAATVAIFLCTYAFYIFVTSPELRNAEVIPLRNVEIGDEIIDLPQGASDYWFWGRTGSYFRTAVLPRLDSLARAERKRIKLRIIVPDPDREGSAELYKSFKKGLGEDADNNTLAANVILTIATSVATVLRNPYLSIEIGLCASVPVLRFDISTSGVLITRDAKDLPAILTNSGNPFFEMFKDALENELSQSRKIRWDDSVGPPLEGQELDPEFLDSISGLPRVNQEILKAASAIQAGASHRYAG
ncbi:hypothetical protein [Bradyrhizobium sp. CCBAU 45384]|uniref:hypothetical protein n=1 Tax=Bradyrhizobium sp. CCBAU 45384 TaxID=858428 RepID=UPI0023066ECB|nr:hypothetical protein [Bradyrhizobium sp. CCBAU 45384]MDA9408340.1 hypothetical protein [Bradyrhizobium sp. CCBAU 45384]